jgi:hypothetical protein
MSKLSLTTRKNIKDSEPKLQANLKKITAATGITFDTEFDWMVLAPVAEEKGYKDRVGEIVYDWYLGGLASSIESFCKDPIQKESFVESFGSAKRITFEIYDPEEGDYSYVKTKNDNGSLVIRTPKERFVSNTSNTGDDLSKTCSGDSGPMTVATRKNIKDQEATRKKNLTRIQKATGIDFEVDVDWVDAATVSKDRGYEDRVGEIIYNWYLDGLASSIETFVKDAIQKESFVETFGEKKTIAITIVRGELDEEHPHRYAYSWINNKDGHLEINIPEARFCSNTSNTGDNLSKACSGDSPMSVATRKNIKDQEVARKKNLTRIQKATGLEFELEVDWVAFAAAAKERGYEDRVGEVIYNWYLDGLASNLESLCKDEMCKEAVGEACEKKVITFQLISNDEMEGNYQKCTFNDGVLVVQTSVERFCSNTSNTGSDIESRL